MKRFEAKYNENYRLVFSDKEELKDDFCVIFIDEKSDFYGAAIHFDDMKAGNNVDVKFTVLKQPKECTNPEEFCYAVQQVFIDIIENLEAGAKRIISNEDDGVYVPNEKKIITQ